MLVGPPLDVVQLLGELGRDDAGDDAGLVEPTGQVDRELAGSVVVHDLENVDVAMLHHRQQLDDDLRVGLAQYLTLAALLGGVDALHLCGPFFLDSFFNDTTCVTEEFLI